MGGVHSRTSSPSVELQCACTVHGPAARPAFRRTPAMATGLRSLCGARGEQPNWWSLLSHRIRQETCLEPGAGLVACQYQLPALLVRRPLWSLVREQTLLKAQPAGGQAVPCLVPKPKPKPSRRSSASRGARSSRAWVPMTLSAPGRASTRTGYYLLLSRHITQASILALTYHACPSPSPNPEP